MFLSRVWPDLLGGVGGAAFPRIAVQRSGCPSPFSWAIRSWERGKRGHTWSGTISPVPCQPPCREMPLEQLLQHWAPAGRQLGPGKILPGGVTPAGSFAADKHRARDHPQVMVLCLSRGTKSHPRGCLCPAPCQRQETEQVMDQLLCFLAFPGCPERAIPAGPIHVQPPGAMIPPCSLCELRATSSPSSQLILSSPIPPKPRAFPGADLEVGSAAVCRIPLAVCWVCSCTDASDIYGNACTSSSGSGGAEIVSCHYLPKMPPC